MKFTFFFFFLFVCKNFYFIYFSLFTFIFLSNCFPSFLPFFRSKTPDIRQIKVFSLSQGLVQLYEFKLAHPQADIDPFLKKTSPYFQNYIGRGLKNIEMERKNKKASGNTTSSTSIPTILPSSQSSGIGDLFLFFFFSLFLSSFLSFFLSVDLFFFLSFYPSVS